MTNVEKYLTEKYYTPRFEGSLAGKRAFHRANISENPKKINEWLKTQDAYTLHKPIRKNFKRRRVIVKGIDYQFQADLVDLQNIAKYNSGFKYLLTCIDVFSKYAWALPLKNKTGTTLVEAFKIIFKERQPKKLQTDAGSEFTNKLFQNYLNQIGVHFFVTKSELKACIAERFNRTLKTKMWRYFTAKNTLTYLNILQDLLHSYNRSYHRSIKMAPLQVNEMNEKKVWNTLYGDLATFTRFKFKIGDQVRISKVKRTFEKGYLPNWTEEIFTIVERIKTNPPVYKIKDWNGEVIDGTYYEEELQGVIKDLNTYFKVEKILDKEKRGRRNYYFVKWSGYPKSFNSWVDESDFKEL